MFGYICIGHVIIYICNMIERVKLLMSVKDLSSAQLAEAIGVQRSGISHILSGRNKPSLDFVVKVLEAYPDLSESWLLKGEGEMLKSATASQGLFSAEEPETPEVMSVVEEEVKLKTDKPMQVNDEDRPHYGNDNLNDHVDFLAKQALESDRNELDDDLNKVPIHSTQKVDIEKIILDKKLVKLIAIYSDDSFKVYHSE